MDAELGNINLSDLSNIEVAMLMRKCNDEKFKAMVRMHLSFELDLNTDEFDLPCHEIVYEDRGKMKKWNRLSKKHKSAHTPGNTASSSTGKSTPSTGTSPMEGIHHQIDPGFLFHLKELKEFLLLEKNLVQEGIFRKTGSVSRQNELRLQIQNDKALDFDSGGYSAHDCATVFKGYLGELPEPLLTDAHYPAHLQLATLCISISLQSSGSGTSASMRPPNPERVKREQHLLNSIQLLLLLIPEAHRDLLQHIIEILHGVAMHAHLNKMSPENLATLFAPHLICPRNLPPEALHYLVKKMSSIIAYMVSKGTAIFDIPAKLSTDIRAYFLERKRKKTMSPEQELDDSVSDIKTVYSFVDREKTAAAHTTNTTDTELAQLYAHIQSLPESSKKRRLIKQFNKHNGQGTPLQVVVMNRLKNSEASRSAKSIGDSIKKHIFHKSIMSRTPKRMASGMTVGSETPNMSNLKGPNQRALFRSPAQGPDSLPSVNLIKSTALPSSSASASACAYPYTLQAHTIQKSISSSSLISASNRHGGAPLLPVDDNEQSSSSSNTELPEPISSGSISAPVSRQTSNDSAATVSLSEPDYCVTPLRVNSIDAGGDKKRIAWNESNLLAVEEFSNPSPLTLSNSGELKSRYKSEPNLRRMPKGKLEETLTGESNDMTPIIKSGNSLTRKLIKGVSMGNLKLQFATPQSTKRLVRSVSASLKRHSHEDSQSVDLLDDVDAIDLDDETFEDDPADHVDGDSASESDDGQSEAELGSASPMTGGSSSNSCELPCGSMGAYQQLLLQQITSTPSLLRGRRSMSPITKSTQRMPKAMQESIMTPRSRKPVMVLNSNLGSSDPNQTAYQGDLPSFREQDEDISIDNSGVRIHGDDTILLESYNDIMHHQHALEANLNFTHTNAEDTATKEGTANDALTSNFKEYLLSRSVLTASPVDSSFYSQPDDFGSTRDIEDLDESQLSSSLLYCLDGNEPEFQDNGQPEIAEGSDNILSTISNSIPLSFNNARKRAASGDCEKNPTSPTDYQNSSAISVKTSEEDKENYEQVEGYLMSKKLHIREFPGETSF